MFYHVSIFCIIIDLNGTPVARHGLILSLHGAAGSRKFLLMGPGPVWHIVYRKNKHDLNFISRIFVIISMLGGD